MVTDGEIPHPDTGILDTIKDMHDDRCAHLLQALWLISEDLIVAC
jgi:hypothetical protein